MKRFRLFLIISALFCFLLLCLLSWLNFFYLPKKARVQVIQEIEKQTGLKVDLGRLSFHLLRGLTLEKLAFRDPKEGKLLFQADRLYVQCLWFPILLEKKFIASSVTFDHPALALTRFPDGRWNFQNFIEKMGQKSASTFFTPKISILRGELLFTDQTFSSPFAKHLKNVNAKMVFGLPVHIRFKVTFGLKESPAFLSATGSRSLTGGAWEVSLRAKELSTSDLAPYAKRYLPLIEEGKGDLSFEVHIDRKGTVSLEKIFFVGKTRFASQALKGETHCRLAGRWVYRPDEKEGFDYDFKAHLEEGIFQTSFLKEPFRETTGELLFTKDALSFRDVKATFGK
ncbi:MAG: DUF748 domain-containing protein, partial [Candidatus Omnitrophica bacterium]|nr:DUF748 domain-containing protein [Candidatus Omnitrophota bacterium]